MADDDSTKRGPGSETGDGLSGSALSAGLKVFGRYVLETEVGRGGMGVVWRGHDEELGETVALKFLPEVLARDDAAVDELKTETRQARRLTHPNIVRIHQFERDGAMAAVSMEFIDGMTLSKLRLQQPGKVFSVEKLAPIVAQICAALDYAHHTAKVAHLDLKPANVLVTKEGVAKVTDFGIARSMTESSTRLTGETRDTGGTLPYMSPQQVLGKKPAAADDIYALGATLYELLTGKPPFHRGDPHSLMKQIAEVVPLPLTEQRAELEITGDDIPTAWQDAILACLAKEPAQRPASVQEFCARLAGPAGRDSVAPLSTAVGAGAGKASPSKNTTPAISRIRLRTHAEEVGLPEIPGGFVVFVFPPEADARVSLGGAVNVPTKKGKVTVFDVLDREYDLRVEAPGYLVHSSRVSVKAGRGLASVTLMVDPGKKAGPTPVAGGTGGMAEEPVREREGGPKQSPDPDGASRVSKPAAARIKFEGAGVRVPPVPAPGLPQGEKAPAIERRPAGAETQRDQGALQPREARVGDADPLLRPDADPPLLVAKTRSVSGVAPARRGLVLRTGTLLKTPAGKVLGAAVLVVVVLLATWAFGWWNARKTREAQQIAPSASQEQQKAGPPAADRQKMATVVCETTPPGARVLINGGDQRGTILTGSGTKAGSVTPWQGVLPPGVYTLRFELKGYKAAEQTVTVAADDTAKVSAVLEEYHGPEEGQRWTIPDLNLEMRPIAAGTFVMGLQNGSIDEKPLTQVTLSRPFWLGRCEVTQEQYEALMGGNPSHFKNAGRAAPVEQVSWTDAMEFCRKLTEGERAARRLPEGYQYTLPTEAQWEYACRAGMNKDSVGRLDNVAWYDRNSGHTTHPVGQKQANLWGLCDLLGNVWEWCLDWRANYPGGSVRDWAALSSGSLRVIRGGGWNHGELYCRSGARYGADPDGRRADIGFRLALAPVR
jgi:formylglycine-generating enzyme required for sulfatase activity/serine/threonine protein kinase